jgi:hypothetical protein
MQQKLLREEALEMSDQSSIRHFEVEKLSGSLAEGCPASRLELFVY